MRNFMKKIVIILAILSPFSVLAIPTNVDRVSNAWIEALIKTDGLIFNASSTIRLLNNFNATSTNATTTNFVASNSFKFGSDFLTDITGTGLSNVSGALTNSGVISNSCPGGFLSCSGTNPSSFTLGTLGIINGGTNQSAFSPNTLIFFDGTSLVSTSSDALYVSRINASSTQASKFNAASTTALDVSGALNVNNASSSINNLNIVNGSSTALSVSGALMVNNASSSINNLRIVNGSSTALSVTGALMVNAASSSINNLNIVNGSSTALSVSGALMVNNATSSISNLRIVNGSSTALDVIGMLNVNNGTSTITNLTMVSATTATLAITSSSTIANARIVNASTTALTINGVASTSVLRIDTLTDGCLTLTSGLVGSGACGAGGGANSKWATSTSVLGIYPNSATYVGIGTTTPVFNLQLSSSTAPQLVLSDGSVNLHWALRNTAGSLYFDPVSQTTYATTSSIAPVFTMLTNSKIGIGTSTPYAALSVVGASGVVANIYEATSTIVASRFPVASTTALSVTGALMVNAASSSINNLNVVFASSTALSVSGALMVNNASSTISNLQATYASSTALTVTGALMVNNASSTINNLNLISATTTGLAYFPGGFIANSASSTIRVLNLGYGSSTALDVTGALNVNNASSSISNLRVVNDITSFSSTTALDVTGALVVNNATSTATNLSILNGTTTNATSTNLSVSNIFRVGTTTSYLAAANVASTGPQLSLSNGAGNAQWVVANEGGNLYIATSSVAGTATTTTSAMTLTGAGKPGLAISSTSPFATLSVNPLAGDYSNEFAVGSSTATSLRIDNAGHVFFPQLVTDAAAHTYTMCGESTTFEARWDTTTCVVSAAKFKMNIKDLDVGLAELLKVRPVEFNYKPTGDSNYDNNRNIKHQQIGVIADEVEKVDDRLVTYDNKGEIKGFNYEQFTAWITKAVQEFYGKFQILAAKVSGLEKKVDDQQRQIDELRSEIQKMR